MNDLDGFRKLMEKHRGDIAAVVMEPVRGHDPESEFLEEIRKVCTKESIVMIFDEITSGWRSAPGGIHKLFKVEPDIAVFGKAMGNGYPVGAIIGKGRVMDSAQSTFISSTFWTERIGPAAAIAVIKKLEKEDVPTYLNSIGGRIQDIWKSCAEKHGLKISVGGIFPLGHFGFEHNQPLLCKSVFTKLMLDRGILATTAFYASYAHKEDDITVCSAAVDETFCDLADGIRAGKLESMLDGRICQRGFKRQHESRDLY